MLDIVPSHQFKKDLKLAKKRGCKIEHLREVVDTLAQEQKLDEKYQLFLFRTGTHSDLF